MYDLFIFELVFFIDVSHLIKRLFYAEVDLFAINSDFLIPVSLQPVVNLLYFKISNILI